MFRTPAARLRASLVCMAAIPLTLAVLDLALFLRAETVTRQVHARLLTGVGPGLTLGRASLSLSGTLTLVDLRFAPAGREIARAPEAFVELDLLRGRPLSITIPRLEVSLDPERLRDLEDWIPAESTGNIALPLILIDRGQVTLRHPEILSQGTEVRFEIRDGEIVKRPDAPLRAHLEVQNPLFGRWRFQWTSGKEGFEARVGTERVEVTEDLRSLASSKVLRHLDKIDPEGPAAVEILLRSIPESDKIGVVVRIFPRGMKLSYAAFPYRLEECEGEVELYPDGALVKHLKGKTHGGEAFLSGRVDGYDYPGSFHFDLRIDGMLVDRKLLDAATPELRNWLEALELRGLLRARGAIQKLKGEKEQVHVPVHVEIVEGSLRYRNFPLPVSAVYGTLFVDHPRVRIDRVRAKSGEAEFDLWGELDLSEVNGWLDLSIDARDVGLNGNLRSALPGPAARALDLFQAAGRADVRVRVTQPTGEREPRYFFSVSLRNATAQYEGAPIPLTGLEGPLFGEVGPSGARIRWDSIRGRFRDSDLRISGEHIEAGRRQETLVDLRASNLTIDDELVAALPEGVRTAISKTGLRGRANLRLDFSAAEAASRFAAEVTLSRAGFEMDVPIEEVEGKLYLTGSTQRDTGDMGILGRIDLAHARVVGKRFGSLSASLTLLRNRLTLSNILGTCYDGVVTGKLSTDLETGEFTAAAHVSAIDLQQMRQDTEGYRQKALGGRLTVAIPQIRGVFGKRDTIAGSGELTIWDGTLWNVPLFLKILSLDVSRWGTSSKFDAGVVRFDIREEKFKIRSAIFRSEEASLVGAGYLDFDWNVNLVFKVETEPLGDFWLFTPINVVINLFSNAFWGVEIKGPFDDPSAGPKLFPKKPK